MECIIDHKMRVQMTKIEILLNGNVVVADRYETGTDKLYLRADKYYGDKRPIYLAENLTYDEMMDFLERLEHFLENYLGNNTGSLVELI